MRREHETEYFSSPFSILIVKIMYIRHYFSAWRKNLNACFHIEKGSPRTPSGGTYMCLTLSRLVKTISNKECEPALLSFFAVLTTKWLYFFVLSLLIDSFEAVGNTVPSLGNYRECPIFCSKRDISENTFFNPTTPYSGLCSSHHTCMKILFRAGFLGLGVIYSEKNFGVHRSHPKIM